MSDGLGPESGKPLEMGISHADFYRIFPRLVSPQSPQYDGLCTSVVWPSGGRLRLRMSAEKVRRIAGLTLTYVELAFEFADFTAAAEREFMQRFLRAFHRGGG